jgi:hypothetical protein
LVNFPSIFSTLGRPLASASFSRHDFLGLGMARFCIDQAK